MDIIDKIVLSKDRCSCAVYLVNGPTLFFNFFKLGMTYIEFIDWIQEVTKHGTKLAA